MGKEQSGNPEMAFLRCALLGAGLIAVIGGGGTYATFVVRERLAREKVARRLQGGWITENGTELWFDFTRGDRGTLELWTPADGESTTRVRIVWTQGGQVALAVGPDREHESYLELYLADRPDRITMGEGSPDGGPAVFMRNRRPASSQPPNGG
jgi:hypothetical protein